MLVVSLCLRGSVEVLSEASRGLLQKIDLLIRTMLVVVIWTWNVVRIEHNLLLLSWRVQGDAKILGHLVLFLRIQLHTRVLTVARQKPLLLLIGVHGFF